MSNRNKFLILLCGVLTTGLLAAGIGSGLNAIPLRDWPLTLGATLATGYIMLSTSFNLVMGEHER